MLFKTDRFGMFIHFGIYSGAGWHEQQQLRMNAPKSEYIKLKDTFNPVDFVADEIVKFAKDSGAQYICFTTKHHIKNIPAPKYMGENMVIKMEFKDADEFFGIRDADKSVIL